MKTFFVLFPLLLRFNIKNRYKLKNMCKTLIHLKQDMNGTIGHSFNCTEVKFSRIYQLPGINQWERPKLN